MSTKFKQITIRLVLLLSTGSAGITMAGQPDLAVPEVLYAEFEQAIRFSNHQQYDSALVIAQDLHNRYPDEPAGYLALISVYQSIADCYRVTIYNREIEAFAQKAVDHSKTKIKQNKRDGFAYFCLASAYGTRTVSYANQGRWLEAFRDGARIKSNFEKAIKYAPQFYDAYYGLGLYNYWVASRAKMIRMLFTGKDKAVEQVRIAKTQGRFLKTTAAYGLSAIYYNDGDYQRSLLLCDSLAALYPQNPTLSYRRGRIYMSLNQWKKARVCFEVLYQIIDAAEYQSAIYKADCLYHLAMCDAELDNPQAARRYYEEASGLEKKFSSNDKLNEACVRIRKHLKKQFD